MAYGNFILDKGYDTTSALTKFRAVTLDSDPESVTAVTADSDVVVGVAQFDVTTAELAKGKGASVRQQGITEWEVSAAVTRGQEVTIDTDGRCKPVSSGKRVWGLALTDADTAGKRAAVEIIRAGRVA